MVFVGFLLIVGDAAGKVLIFDMEEFKCTLIAHNTFNAAINSICVSPHFSDVFIIGTDAGELIFVDFELKRV